MNPSKEIARLLKAANRDLADWHADPLIIKIHSQQPTEELEKYVSGSPGYVAVKVKVGSLLKWSFAAYELSALVDKHDSSFLTQAAKYALWSGLMAEPSARIGRAGPLLKNHAAFFLALQIICGWKNRALALGDALVEGLDTGLLDLRINDRHDAGSLYPHFWFLIQLFRAGKGESFIDMTPYSHPENMAPYDQVLADWKTTDLVKVKQWVEDMAEHHLRETDDSDQDAVNEFDDPRFKLFPYEILAFLRIREWAGLENPASFDHPLMMNQPLAYLPPLAELPLPDPETPLLDRVLVRYKQEWPDLRIPAGL